MPNMISVGLKEGICTTCWYLWWIRRQVTHNETIPPPNRWPISVMAISGGYNKVSNQNREDTEHRWKRPGPKFVKVNVDAAFYQDAGAEATARYNQRQEGQFLAARGGYNDCASDATAMEARAMRDGLQFANSLGFNRVEAESDSLEVIQFCTGQT